MTEYKELNLELKGIGEVLKHKDHKIKTLKLEGEKMSLQLESLEEDLKAKDRIIQTQASEISHTKSIMESRICELEEVVNSQRFRKGKISSVDTLFNQFLDIKGKKSTISLDIKPGINEMDQSTVVQTS